MALKQILQIRTWRADLGRRSEIQRTGRRPGKRLPTIVRQIMRTARRHNRRTWRTRPRPGTGVALSLWPQRGERRRNVRRTLATTGGSTPGRIVARREITGPPIPAGVHARAGRGREEQAAVRTGILACRVAVPGAFAQSLERHGRRRHAARVAASSLLPL